MAGRATPEEEQWTERIEGLRSELEASGEELEFQDFGAGSATSQPSAEEAARGVTVRRTVGDICRHASKRQPWAGVLFHVIRETRPPACLELGTAVGISAAYQAAALELNGAGRLLSLEGGESLARKADENLTRLGLGHRVELRPGRFADTLPAALEERGPFDYVFVDGHHDESATVDYFRQIAPSVPSGGVMLFDDVDWSEGMSRAWEAIHGDERVAGSAAVGPLGLCSLR